MKKHEIDVVDLEEFNIINEARQEKFIQLTLWVPTTKEELNFLKKFRDQILLDETRGCVIVLRYTQAAVFGNDMSSKF